MRSMDVEIQDELGNLVLMDCKGEEYNKIKNKKVLLIEDSFIPSSNTI